jgi:hypothetical protein
MDPFVEGRRFCEDGRYSDCVPLKDTALGVGAKVLVKRNARWSKGAGREGECHVTVRKSLDNHACT